MHFYLVLMLVLAWGTQVSDQQQSARELTLRKVFCAYFKPTSYEYRKYNLGRLCTAKVKKFANSICVTNPRDRDSPIAETCRDMSFLDTFVRVKSTTQTLTMPTPMPTTTKTTVLATQR